MRGSCASVVCVQSVGRRLPMVTMRAFEELCIEFPSARLERFRHDYRYVARTIHELATVVGYTRPAHSRPAHPFMQRDFPIVARDKLSPGHVLEKAAFTEAACTRRSPFELADEAASAALDSDLVAAIDVVASAGPNIVPMREERMRVLRSLVDRLDPMRCAIDEVKGESARRIAARFNVAWAAATIDGIEWPDIHMPKRYVSGFPVVFDVPDSGVFKPDEQPAEISAERFMANNTRMVSNISTQIEKAAREGEPNERERRRQCWKRTREEIDDGLVGPPMTRAKVDRKYGRGKWRPLGRSAIIQKGKYRCIDNGKRSKRNKATSMHERITCGRSDFPPSVSREFARRAHLVGSMRGEHMQRVVRMSKRSWRQSHVRKFRMRHGTNDLFAAYRRVPTSQPEFTVVAVYCYEAEPEAGAPPLAPEDAGAVRYCEVPGHNFGLQSAVVNFNRFPELAVAVSRRLMWIVNEHYFDDNDTCEPGYAHNTGQVYLVELSSDRFYTAFTLQTIKATICTTRTST